MGVRTRGLDISINAKRQVADAAARAEAKGVIDRWNEQRAASRDMLWSPTIRAALIAGTPWPDVFCQLLALLKSASNRFMEVGMSTKSEPSPQKRSNWYDDPRMTAEQKRETVKQFHDWCERKGLLLPQGS
jgi:hypothetical protein